MSCCFLLHEDWSFPFTSTPVVPKWHDHLIWSDQMPLAVLLFNVHEGLRPRNQHFIVSSVKTKPSLPLRLFKMQITQQGDRKMREGLIEYPCFEKSWFFNELWQWKCQRRRSWYSWNFVLNYTWVQFVDAIETHAQNFGHLVNMSNWEHLHSWSHHRTIPIGFLDHLRQTSMACLIHKPLYYMYLKMQLSTNSIREALSRHIK